MKNICVFSDGTGNGAAKRHGTNVWRLYQALDVHRDDQIACYDDGVGSQEFLPLKLLGGAFGFGLKTNVLELYKFLCRNYDEGDRIYLFGFSRGAFTVRTLAGMIHECGLYTGCPDDEELDSRAEKNYHLFRTHFKQTWLSRRYGEYIGVEMVPEEGTVFPDIEFIGVWDTVDAYGFPVDEVADFWDRCIFPIRFPDQRLSTKVKKACHALSIDDERRTFHPVLWDEKGETDLVARQKVSRDRIEQVWFAGVHSDVGGGYPRRSLSLVTLDWMISKVEATDESASGLHFIKEERDGIFRHADWHGPQHDSRSGLGAYYRYEPRFIDRLCDDRKYGVYIENPKIHRSVMERIKDNVVSYAPTGLPQDYEVVATRGTPPPYESDEGKQKRMAAKEGILDVIRSRKVLYHAFLLTTLMLIASRYLLEFRPGETCGKDDCWCEWFIGVLPDFATPWAEALMQNPLALLGFVAIFGTLFVLKRIFWKETVAKAMHAWEDLKQRTE